MEEDNPVGFDSLTLTSVVSGSSVSLMDPPSRLDKEYEPLRDIYASNSEPLPMKEPGIKESNSEALIEALKALQLKIRRLEQERSDAATHFRHLSQETQRKGTDDDDGEVTLTDEEENIPPHQPHPPLHIDTDHSFDRRLNSLDTRFALQAKELELLKDRLRQAESDREEALKKTKELETIYWNSPKTMKELEKRLRTNNKLKKLEGELLMKQWEKRRPTGPHPSQTKKNRKDSTTKKCGHGSSTVYRSDPSTAGGRGHPIVCSKPVPGVHYHLDMRDVPFVVGTSTAPSHSVSANYQKVLSLMKDHNKLLCGAVAEEVRTGDERLAGGKKTRSSTATGGKKKKKSLHPLPTGASLDELRGLLKALEEEFAALTFRHQDLSRAIQESQQHPDETCNGEELNSELDDVISQLESKMEQIEIIKKQISATKRTKKEKSSRSSVSSKGKKDFSYNGKSNYYNSLKSSSSSGSVGGRGQAVHDHASYTIHSGGSTPRDSLAVLKGMKRLQNTLQRDDLSWN